MDKVIIRETGELLGIKSNWVVSKMSLTITTPDDMCIDDIISQHKQINSYQDRSDGHYYILSNDKEYMDTELIIGLDNIRDYMINKVVL